MFAKKMVTNFNIFYGVNKKGSGLKILNLSDEMPNIWKCYRQESKFQVQGNAKNKDLLGLSWQMIIGIFPFPFSLSNTISQWV